MADDDHDWRRLERPHDFRHARQMLDLTQSQMAAALELKGGADAKDTVRFWESGKKIPSGPVRVAIRLMLEQANLF